MAALDQVTVEYNIQIEKSKAALDQLEQSYRKNEATGTASANKVSGAFQKTGGIIENLNAHLQSLERRRDKAMSPQAIQAFNKRIDETRAKIQALTGQVEKGGNSMVNTFQRIGSAIGIAFGVHTLARFGKELLNRALDVEEVRIAFNKLNNPTLLDNLKKAVGGTVAELNLMKAALKAQNLGIPVQQLATAFEFAEKRAGALGLSTEEVIDTIIQGIGSKSTKAFTAMGIDALRVQDALKGMNAETASVVDISRALGEIFTEELGKMGESVDSNSDKLERLRARWQDLKDDISLVFLEFVVGESAVVKTMQAFEEQANFWRDTAPLVEGFASALGTVVGNLNNIETAAGKAFAALENFTLGSAGASVGGQKKAVVPVAETEQKGESDLVKQLRNFNNMILQAKQEIAQSQQLDPFAVFGEQASEALEKTTEELEENEKRRRQFQEESREEYERAMNQRLDLLQQVAQAENDLANAQLNAAQAAISGLRSFTKENSEIFIALTLLEKAVAVAQVIFNEQTALAAITAQTAAILPIIPPGVPNPAYPIAVAAGAAQAALVKGQAAISIGTILATLIPTLTGFAEGVVDLEGPGTTKSDSILARLSKRESVITAEGTARDPGLLEAMNESQHAFEKYLTQNYVWPYMEAAIKAHTKQESKGMTFSDRNLLKELKLGNRLQIKTTQALINAMNKKQSKRRYWN